MSAQGPKGAQNGKRPGGRERILAAALEILEQDGEAALKFVEIAARADVAISVITHHFGTREGLLSAVHARRFAGLTELDLAVIKQLADTAGGREGVQVGRAALTDGIVDPERAAVRLGRIMAIGATHGRPSLEAAVRSTATEVLDNLERGIIALQAKGFVDRKVDARVFATFVQAYALGMIIIDLDEKPVSREALARFIDQANAWVLTEPED